MSGVEAVLLDMAACILRLREETKKRGLGDGGGGGGCGGVSWSCCAPIAIIVDTAVLPHLQAFLVEGRDRRSWLVL